MPGRQIYDLTLRTIFLLQLTEHLHKEIEVALPHNFPPGLNLNERPIAERDEIRPDRIPEDALLAR
jgi:hypothetical protein